MTAWVVSEFRLGCEHAATRTLPQPTRLRNYAGDQAEMIMNMHARKGTANTANVRAILAVKDATSNCNHGAPIGRGRVRTSKIAASTDAWGTPVSCFQYLPAYAEAIRNADKDASFQLPVIIVHHPDLTHITGRAGLSLLPDGQYRGKARPITIPRWKKVQRGVDWARRAHQLARHTAIERVRLSLAKKLPSGEQLHCVLLDTTPLPKDAVAKCQQSHAVNAGVATKPNAASADWRRLAGLLRASFAGARAKAGQSGQRATATDTELKSLADALRPLFPPQVDAAHLAGIFYIPGQAVRAIRSGRLLPLLFVDYCHCSGHHFGGMYVISGRDGNGILPLCVHWTPLTEVKKGWWITCRRFRHVVECDSIDEWGCNSDKMGGMEEVVHDALRCKWIRWCSIHGLKFIAKHKPALSPPTQKKLTSLYWYAVLAYKEDTHRKAMQAMPMWMQSHMLRKPRAEWASAYAPDHNFGITSQQGSESFNNAIKQARHQAAVMSMFHGVVTKIDELYAKAASSAQTCADRGTRLPHVQSRALLAEMARRRQQAGLREKKAGGAVKASGFARAVRLRTALASQRWHEGGGAPSQTTARGVHSLPARDGARASAASPCGCLPASDSTRGGCFPASDGARSGGVLASQRRRGGLGACQLATARGEGACQPATGEGEGVAE